MKTVKRILLSVLVFALIGACDTPEDVVPQKFAPNQTNFHFEAELQASPFTAQNGLDLKITQKTTCNLAEEMIVELNSTARYRFGIEQIELHDGEIDIILPQTGSYLVGEFEGRAIQNSDQLIIDAEIFVYLGTGALEADGGELSLNIIGTPISDQFTKYSITIDGYLENRVPKANSPI